MLAFQLSIDPNTMVKFIQEARQLKAIHLIDMNVNDSVIKGIAEIISNRKENNKLIMFVNAGETFDSLSITNDENILRSLKIEYT